MSITQEEVDYIQREWADLGRLVLRDHGVVNDLEAIYRWVGWFIANGAQDEDYALILSHAYHSLNLDIPFAATHNVREKLIAAARFRLNEPPRPS